MTYGAVILAAGEARRFGKPKQLLQWQGETLLERACRLAITAGCHPVRVVLGARREAIARLALPPEVTLVTNENWQEGMGNSLACGVRSLPEVDAVFVLLVDQPGVTVETLLRMKAPLESGEASLVQCQAGEWMGPPALFARAHFSELAQLQGEEGGRAVIRKHLERRALVSAPEAKCDIDSEAEWETFCDQQKS
ncbi:nucleotidyltransferase family protein [Roseibacillus ishigakijimensis]|uniref:Nucleotidyltransferase family protein n=1 Tax=Roseibacillus ishigakijimensis TaxID=454146 RepID=A0A934VHC7_9BACT|nr:nucleotidyltransferase family protein [Roseibacillus ishigakijimensis]MBK1833808.1 nucleotidyltransferase family protein [Roseibacillus ishigakijimensis]